MIAPMIVVFDEVGDGALEITGKIVVFEQDSALQREVPSLDLALGHGVVGFAARVLHALTFKPTGEIARDVGWPVVGEQPRPTLRREEIKRKTIEQRRRLHLQTVT